MTVGCWKAMKEVDGQGWKWPEENGCYRLEKYSYG